MDENNQHGFAMTKPMPTDCVKEHPAPTWHKFNFLLQTLGNSIGHLFIADKFRLSLIEQMQRNDSTCTMKLLLLSLKKSFKIKSTICVSALYLFSKANDTKPNLIVVLLNLIQHYFQRNSFHLSRGVKIFNYKMLLEGHQNFFALFIWAVTL